MQPGFCFTATNPIEGVACAAGEAYALAWAAPIAAVIFVLIGAALGFAIARITRRTPAPPAAPSTWRAP